MEGNEMSTEDKVRYLFKDIPDIICIKNTRIVKKETSFYGRDKEFLKQVKYTTSTRFVDGLLTPVLDPDQSVSQNKGTDIPNQVSTHGLNSVQLVSREVTENGHNNPFQGKLLPCLRFLVHLNLNGPRRTVIDPSPTVCYISSS